MSHTILNTLAHLVEHPTYNQSVVGSIPTSEIICDIEIYKGRVREWQIPYMSS